MAREASLDIMVREASLVDITMEAVVDIPALQMVDMTMATTIMYILAAVVDIPARQMEEGIIMVREASQVDITMATTIMAILAAVVAVVTTLTTFTGQPSLQNLRLQNIFDRMVMSVLSTVMMVTSA